MEKLLYTSGSDKTCTIAGVLLVTVLDSGTAAYVADVQPCRMTVCTVSTV